MPADEYKHLWNKEPAVYSHGTPSNTPTFIARCFYDATFSDIAYTVAGLHR